MNNILTQEDMTKIDYSTMEINQRNIPINI